MALSVRPAERIGRVQQLQSNVEELDQEPEMLPGPLDV